ncbi:MAG: hypothetical protein CL578_11890 [Alteromonadaceae bacterium]|nr:hypothetical protein [Alteromonadaceae bacterium]
MNGNQIRLLLMQRFKTISFILFKLNDRNIADCDTIKFGQPLQQREENMNTIEIKSEYCPNTSVEASLAKYIVMPKPTNAAPNLLVRTSRKSLYFASII